MLMNFTKMHGLGNDFVVCDAINQQLRLQPEQLRRIADRRFGIGCDQILLVEPAQSSQAEFRYRIFNADGGEVEQCGNGARCFARFVYQNGLTESRQIPVETAAGMIELQLEDDGQVTVDMGIPGLEPETLPFVAESRAQTYTIDVNGATLRSPAGTMGTPHAL